MTGPETITLVALWMVAGASPGPATLAIAGTAMERGRTAGLAVASGIILGSATWGLAAALGMSAVMLGHVWLVEAIRYAGAAYLVFLGLKSLRAAFRAGQPLARPVQTRALWRVGLKGALIHLTNPKAIFAWAAIFAIAVPPGSPAADVWRTYGLLIAASTVVFLGYGVLFSSARMVALYARARRGFEAVFGVLFGAAGLMVLTARITP